MTRYLYVDQAGEPVYTATYSSSIDVPVTPSIYRSVELAEGVDETDVMNFMWLDGSNNLTSRPPKPSPYHKWEPASLTWVVPTEELDRLKAARCAEVNALRDVKSQEPITYGNDAFDVDDKAVERVRVLMARIERGDGLTSPWVGWRTFNNSMVWVYESPTSVMSHLQNIMRLVEDRHQQCLITSWGHKDSICAMSNYKDVINHDITANWP